MRFYLIILFPIVLIENIYSQKFYKTSGGELIFSRPVSNDPFPNTTSHTRMSIFFHFNKNYHYDFSKAAGFYSGYSISNIGFIYENGDTTFKKRAYTFGIPLAFKFGDLNNYHFLFAGGEVEFPFHFKQKKITGDQKSKNSSFFDNRVNTILPSVFAGMQFSDGYCFKIRVYLTDFLNKDFTGTDFGIKTDYKNTSTQLFLLSLCINLKQNKINKIINTENRYALEI